MRAISCGCLPTMSELIPFPPGGIIVFSSARFCSGVQMCARSRSSASRARAATGASQTMLCSEEHSTPASKVLPSTTCATA